MMKALGTLAAAALLALAGCGGGGDGATEKAAEVVASTSSFPLRTAMNNIAGPGLNLTLAGKDNAFRTSNNQQNFNDWTGTYSVSSRPMSQAVLSTTPQCAEATRLVDIKVVLLRARDGYRLTEAMTVGYTDDFKPICAFLLDGAYWWWNLSEPLPTISTLKGNVNGVEFTGGVDRDPDAVDLNGTTGEVDSELTSLISLEADTASTAYMSFLFQVSDYTNVSHTEVRMFGNSVEMRYKIDEAGQFRGLQYIRTGVLPDASGDVVVTMESK